MKLFVKLLPIFLVVFPLSAAAVSLYGDTSVQAKATAGATTTVETGASGSVRVETPSDVEVNVDRSGDGSAEVTIENKAATGDPDFDLLVSAVITGNEQVAGVDVDADGEVDVAYRHDGRFLGFIPIKVTSHTIVKAGDDGTVSVTVRMPWWSFLVSGVSTVRSDVEGLLKASAEVEAHASVNASAESRLKLVEIMVSSLKAAADASANTSASVNE